MIDERLLAGDDDAVEFALLKRGIDLDTIRLARERTRRARAMRRDAESLRAEGNRMQRGETERDGLVQAKQARRAHQAACERAQADMAAAIDGLPNLPHASVPDGRDEAANVVVAEFTGIVPTNVAEVLPCGRFDAAESARVAGTGFELLRGSDARMLRALSRFALEINANEFEELSLPALVSTAAMQGSAHLPKFAAGAYAVAGESLWLAPTAEVAFVALLRGARLKRTGLPARHMAHVPCFRREIGSGGITARFRLHQYQQVELFSVCEPERSLDELQFLLECAQRALRRLHLRYRIVELCSACLPFSAAKAYKLEIYFPRSDRWIDVSTVSLATDFLARRSDIRLSGGGGLHVHTLNASALACTRVRLALLEYGYSSDPGAIPEALLTHYLSTI